MVSDENPLRCLVATGLASWSLGANRTATFRTHLVSTGYRAMKSSWQYMNAADYTRALQAAGDALVAKPGDAEAITLQREATGLGQLQQDESVPKWRVGSIHRGMPNWKWDAESFSLTKFFVLRNALKTGAFTDQKRRVGRHLFSLWHFEKFENETSHWYHWLIFGLVARTGIEPVFQP